MKNGLLDENGKYKPVDNKYKYPSMTKESLERMLNDLMYNQKNKPEKGIVVYALSIEAMKEFDNAMKAELLKYEVKNGSLEEGTEEKS